MTSIVPYTLGTRGSQLALTQSRWVAEQIRLMTPNVEIQIEVIRTTGDQRAEVAMAELGGKSAWTKELEAALIEGRIDFAVHSMKDVPIDLPEGLVLGAVPRRANPYDAFVSPRFARLADLPQDASVGTSSLRRAAQLRAYRPDLNIIPLRGNVDTRVNRVNNGDFDATILACAGLERLGRADVITEEISAEIMVPAPGQGALALEYRGDDSRVRELLARLNDPVSEAEALAERACLGVLGADCNVPLGVLARVAAGRLSLQARVCSEAGDEVINAAREGRVEDAEALGKSAAEELLAHGADRLIQGS